MTKVLTLEGAFTSNNYFTNMPILILSINHQLNEIAFLLIDNGADVSVVTKDDNGDTFMDYAKSMQMQNLCSFYQRKEYLPKIKKLFELKRNKYV